PYGSATSVVSVVTVNSDPHFTSQPANTNVPPSSRAIFSVAAVGTAPLSYQWQKGGFNLANGSSGSTTIYSGSQTATLTLDNVDFADTGSIYTCIVTNGNSLTAIS